jgi:integrase
MGHGSKQMVYEVYGDYIEGLEEDYEKILSYFGPDFIQRKTKTPAYHRPGESFGESHPKQKRNP